MNSCVRMLELIDQKRNLLVRGFFRPVPYLAFPLYLNSRTGNETETRRTNFAGNVNIVYKLFLITVCCHGLTIKWSHLSSIGELTNSLLFLLQNLFSLLLDILLRFDLLSVQLLYILPPTFTLD
jgi:hypothetical protein